MKSSKILQKANCYNCKNRSDVPGSAHSECKNKVAQVLGYPATQMLMLTGNLTVVDKNTNEKVIEVVGNWHGVRSGWFTWPFDFDPCWLEACSLFENHE